MAIIMDMEIKFLNWDIYVPKILGGGGVITLMILEESIPIYPPPIYATTNTVASVHYPGAYPVIYLRYH